MRLASFGPGDQDRFLGAGRQEKEDEDWVMAVKLGSYSTLQDCLVVSYSMPLYRRFNDNKLHGILSLETRPVKLLNMSPQPTSLTIIHQLRHHPSRTGCTVAPIHLI